MATSAYTPHVWEDSELITKEKLNQIETGIKTVTDGVIAVETNGPISSVSVETLEAGEEAEASFAEGVLTLKIPKGDKGDKGDAGAQGQKGDRGDAGAQGAKGDKGETGSAGPAGTRGSKIEFVTQAPSATEGYLEGDIAINTTDWKLYAFASGSWSEKGTIKGADGAKGTKGDKGDTGTAGAKGDTGAAGADGKQGASYRISTETFSASKSDCSAAAVSPAATVLPIIVGDLIEDATGAVWQVASVADGTFTVGEAAVKAAAA